MFQNAAETTNYALAGKAVLTLESRRTGRHYTYKIGQAKDARRWFVSLLTGADNVGDYTYVGLLDERDGAVSFRLTAKSKLPESAPPVAGFAFAWRWLQTGEMPPNMTIRHEGRCGCCGRRLTVPESIDSGIGPECAKKRGIVISAAKRAPEPTQGGEFTRDLIL